MTFNFPPILTYFHHHQWNWFNGIERLWPKSTAQSKRGSYTRTAHVHIITFIIRLVFSLSPISSLSFHTRILHFSFSNRYFIPIVCMCCVYYIFMRNCLNACAILLETTLLAYAKDISLWLTTKRMAKMKWRKTRRGDGTKSVMSEWERIRARSLLYI